MNCSSCGTFNNSESKFCIKCGQSLVNEQVLVNPIPVVENINPTPVSTNINVEPVVNNINEVEVINDKVAFMDYFKVMLSFIIKPNDTQSNELNRFKSFKNSIFLSLIVSIIAVIIRFIKVVYSTVKVTSYDYSLGKDVTTWVFDNLKNVNFIELIFKNLLIYLGAIFVISIIYYLASLVVKKEISFAKVLAITSISVIPLILSIMVLSPLITLVSAKLSIPVVIIGGVYTFTLLYEGINKEIALNGNVKYYLNFICLTIIFIIIYYVAMNMLMDSISGGLGSLYGMFK